MDTEAEGKDPGPVAGAGTCDSCGLPATDLAEVRRAYLTPDDTGELVVGEIGDEIERWCGSCRAHYPHVEATEAGGAGTGEATGA